MTKDTAHSDTPRPVVLCILDGWGHREACENNAICQAATPNLDRLFAASLAVHAFLDGRDTPPRSADGRDLRPHARLSARLPTRLGARARHRHVAGRYYAMDRDKRWDRVERPTALVQGEGELRRRRPAASPPAMRAGPTTSSCCPTVVGGGARRRRRRPVHGQLPRRPRPRADAALLDPGFDGFARKRDRLRGGVVGMTEYSAELPLLATLFPPRPRQRAGRGGGRAPEAPAAHRRDREVRPRHLLLQRRPRGGFEGEERIWCRRRTSRPTT
jgi:bisphosphoglycerate-independent phosphoglycerate mutase (AlkP superfamily)